jgi:hypothetical protein
VTDESAFSHVLLDSLRERLRARKMCSAIELSVVAAIEPEVEQRASALVALAHRLREEREGELSRLAVDAAIALDAGPAPTRAARTVSVLLLADEGHLGAAAALGEQLLAEAHDPGVLKALSLVYFARWRETRDEAWHERWSQIDALRRGEDEESLAPASP